jgi:hypothetical protein
MVITNIVKRSGTNHTLLVTRSPIAHGRLRLSMPVILVMAGYAFNMPVFNQILTCPAAIINKVSPFRVRNVVSYFTFL